MLFVLLSAALGLLLVALYLKYYNYNSKPNFANSSSGGSIVEELKKNIENRQQLKLKRQEEILRGKLAVDFADAACPNYKSILSLGAYDPAECESVQRFKVIQENSQCLFARTAKIWGSPKFDKGLTLEENVMNCLAVLVKMMLEGRDLALDGFVIEIQGYEFSNTLENFGQTVRRVLTAVSSNDPAQRFVMSDEDLMGSRGWRFQFNDENIFVTSFAPCYPETNARYAFGAGEDVDSCFVLLQPEYSFGLHNLGQDHVWDDNKKTIRQKIRQNFVDNGRRYYVPATLNYPMAPLIVPPLTLSDKPVRWWRN